MAMRARWWTVRFALLVTLVGSTSSNATNTRPPWRGVDDLELATLSWVCWFNHNRLHSALGYRPPVEYEDIHYRQSTARLQPLPG